jgi:hypothetical protein
MGYAHGETSNLFMIVRMLVFFVALSTPAKCNIVEDLYSISRAIDRGKDTEMRNYTAQEITAKIEDIAFILDQGYHAGLKKRCESPLAAILAEITEKLPQLEGETHNLSLLFRAPLDAEDILSDLPPHKTAFNIYNVIAAFHALNESLDGVIRWYYSAGNSPSPQQAPPLQLSINFEKASLFVDLWEKRLHFIAQIDLFCQGRGLLNIFIQELQRLYLKIKILAAEIIKSAKAHTFEEITELMQSGVLKSITKQDGLAKQIYLNELLSKINVDEGGRPASPKLVLDKSSVIYRTGNLAANLQQVLDDFKIKR